MPIRVACPQCQKTLTAADEHAGKMARCPSCGTQVQLTPGAQQPQQRAASPSGVGAKALACPSCERMLSLKQEHAGHRISCPACKTPLFVAADLSALRTEPQPPTAEAPPTAASKPSGAAPPPVRRPPSAAPSVQAGPSAAQAAPPVAAAAAPAVPGLGEEDDPLLKDWKRKRRRRGAGFGFLIPVGLFGLLAVGLAVPMVYRGGGSSDALRWMPDDPDIILSMQWQELWNSPLAKRARNELPQFEQILTNGLDEVDLKVEDIESVTAGGTIADEQMVVAIRTTRDVRLEEVLHGENADRFEEEKVGKYTVYREALQDVSICLVGPRMVLSGKSGAVDAVLKRKGKPKFSDGLQAALDTVDLDEGIAFAARVNTADLGNLPGAGPVPLAGFAQTLQSIRGVAGTMRLGSDVELEGHLLCGDSTTAKTFKEQLAGLVSMAKMGAAQQAPEMQSAMDSVQVEQSGSTVSISFIVPGDAAIDMAVKQSQQVPGLQMPDLEGEPAPEVEQPEEEFGEIRGKIGS